MGLQLLDVLKESITVSPVTLFAALSLGIVFYYVISGLFGSTREDNHRRRSMGTEEKTRPTPPPPPPPVQVGEITAEELKQYDGSDPNKPILMAIKGQIYDVSQSRFFYGPGGPYAPFAGRDASRALAKMSFEEKDLTGDISSLNASELESLKDWEYKFMAKYVKVGTVKKTGPVTMCATMPNLRWTVVNIQNQNKMVHKGMFALKPWKPRLMVIRTRKYNHLSLRAHSSALTNFEKPAGLMAIP